jgi:type II secretion system protein N
MKALKWVGYTWWFLFFFVVGVLFTFPIDDLKPQLVALLEDGLGKGKQGAYGQDPKVEIGSLTLAGFGVNAERVMIQLASRNPEPGPVIDIDDLSVSVRPWTLLSSTRTVAIDAELYDGDISGTVTVDDKGAVHAADIEVNGLDLGKMPMLVAAIGLPMGGKLDADVDLELGPQPEKSGTGDIKLTLKGLSLGPGSPKAAAAFGGFNLPQLELGTLSGQIPVAQGKGTLEHVKLDGKDLQLELTADITFKSKLQSSRLNLDGWFFPTPALFEKDAKLKTLIDLGESFSGSGPSLSKAKDEDGHYHFSVRGNFGSPNASLARDGKKAAKKAGKAPAEKPAEKPTDGDSPG